jgi:hypothetical protein
MFVCWKQFWPLEKNQIREQVLANFDYIFGLIEHYAFIRKLIIAVWLQNFFNARSKLVRFFGKN